MNQPQPQPQQSQPISLFPETFPLIPKIHTENTLRERLDEIFFGFLARVFLNFKYIYIYIYIYIFFFFFIFFIFSFENINEVIKIL